MARMEAKREGNEVQPDRARPWLKFYGGVPANLDYPDVSLYAALAATAQRIPDAFALDFFDTTLSYRELIAAVDRCAHALAALGLCAGERLLIAMPTAPQGVIAFYAANRLGALAALVHPLATTPEIEHYLDATGARIALTLDACYARLAAARPRLPLQRLILARIPDYLPRRRRLGFWLAKGWRIPRVPADDRVQWWSALMAMPHAPAAPAPARSNDAAVIFFSGGTTGQPKGIVLSNRNLIAEGMQAAAWSGLHGGDAILAILPIFHGFGLGVCVNAALMAGGTAILVPAFSAATVARLLRTKRPNLLVGVPTLFDALSRDASLANADLSCLRATFCGADTLPRAVKERFEKLVAARGGKVRLLEGYGLTEAVTAIMAMPLAEYREGSIGIPFPDMLAAICRPDSTEQLPVGAEGEICICGPAVMLGYLDDAQATASALRVHADGRTWLHTGDLGRRDEDGFFYFTVRMKRLIKSSGFNVYPAQVEATLAAHPLVAEVCVVGVADAAQVERVKAFVVLEDAAQANAATERLLIAHCHERMIKWSCPREIEFRAQLPHTRVGKIDYLRLSREQRAHPETAENAAMESGPGFSHGGDRVAAALQAHGVRFLFTLCGGHIAPIVSASKARGMRIIDVRDEATALFAADAVARLSGVPGVAVVTAGPGLTNTITALKNAQLAQSPVLLIGGAAPTMLQGRGALQDIDQRALIAPHVKRMWRARRVTELGSAIEEAFEVACAGVPGPVFIECPVDLLYAEATIRQWYGDAAGKGRSLADRLMRWYLARHVARLFAGATRGGAVQPRAVRIASPSDASIEAASAALAGAARPLLVIGSQALVAAADAAQVAAAVSALGVPVYLSGMARGLLGREHPLQLRHQRRQALRESDCVVLAGVPSDFRLDYGRHVRRGATLIAANRSAREARRNRKPDIAAIGDAGAFLVRLAARRADAPTRWPQWIDSLHARERARESEIDASSSSHGEFVNPIALLRALERTAAEDAVMIADGGDFVATASYVLHPRGPLSWLDPGVFGTLGVGAGFALGAALCRPNAQVWIVFGDGACGYGLVEFDTFVRHGIPVIAIVGNDAGWTQIAREQVKLLGDDVGTVLARTAYHEVAAGFGAQGIVVKCDADIGAGLARAKELAQSGKPVLVNVWLDRTDFREGSISM